MLDVIVWLGPGLCPWPQACSGPKHSTYFTPPTHHHHQDSNYNPYNILTVNLGDSTNYDDETETFQDWKFLVMSRLSLFETKKF